MNAPRTNDSLPPRDAASHPTGSGHSPHALAPVLKKRIWPYWFAWLAPLAAACAAGFYFYHHLAAQGPVITIRMLSAEGFRAGETLVEYRGVPIGKVKGLGLTEDHRHAVVQVQLEKGHPDFAREGAVFWVVRPEISGTSLQGLGTILSGPYINSEPGSGDPAREFSARNEAPDHFGDGLELRVHAPTLEHFQPHSPIYYRGIQVGEVRDMRLGTEADRVEAHIIIFKNYSHLVRTGSKFWSVAAFDFEAGLFSGIHVRLESPKAIVSGALAFATPEKDMGGVPARNTDYELQKDPPKDWVKWMPKISIKSVKANAEP